MVQREIPEEQFGFMKGKSTLHAVKCIQEDIEDALKLPKGKLHAVFIDYAKAFDFLNRKKNNRKTRSHDWANSLDKDYKAHTKQ